MNAFEVCWVCLGIIVNAMTFTVGLAIGVSAKVREIRDKSR